MSGVAYRTWGREYARAIASFSVPVGMRTTTWPAPPSTSRNGTCTSNTPSIDITRESSAWRVVPSRTPMTILPHTKRCQSDPDVRRTKHPESLGVKSALAYGFGFRPSPDASRLDMHAIITAHHRLAVNVARRLTTRDGRLMRSRALSRLDPMNADSRRPACSSHRL
jgi:hypothetical protein